MKVSSSIVVSIAALALGISTAAFAGSTPAPDNAGTAHMPSTVPPGNDGTAHMPATTGQGNANKPADTPGPHASLPSKAKAYGRYCQGQSKQHVAGQKGTAFSQCVTAMAKAAHTSAPTNTGAQVKSAARTACKGMSRKHAAGGHGSPFSQCVSGAAKLLKDQRAHG